MGRNRSKEGRLADECPERISKFLTKLKKTKRYKKSLLKQLNRDIINEGRMRFYSDETCQERVDRIKDKTTELRKEVRELEKELKISRKQSQEFGKEVKIKKNQSKSEKLTRRR